MLFAVRFFDHAAQGQVRQQYLPAHLLWLDQHRETILVGGSLRHDPQGAAIGGLWIVEAADKVEIEQLLQSDPFWIQGLRQSYEILHWSKAFPERTVPV